MFLQPVSGQPDPETLKRKRLMKVKSEVSVDEAAVKKVKMEPTDDEVEENDYASESLDTMSEASLSTRCVDDSYSISYIYRCSIQCKRPVLKGIKY